ncbi:MAG TPA: hypothetical protein DEA66_00775 [Flavobacteriales bacterium]|nr:hypothetical protein [Flavobacteriales bacterium]
MKKALPLFLAAVVAVAVVAWSMYNKPHKDYAQEEVTQTFRADDLVTSFAENPNGMQAQWQEKVVEVTGTVRSSSMQGVVLNPGVVATYDEGHAPEVAPTGQVTIKGRLVGFDDLFGEVRIDHARLSN